MSVLLAILIGSTPVAQAPAQPEKPVATKKVCKRLDDDTGTRMARRVCKTVPVKAEDAPAAGAAKTDNAL